MAYAAILLWALVAYVSVGSETLLLQVAAILLASARVAEHSGRQQMPHKRALRWLLQHILAGDWFPLTPASCHFHWEQQRVILQTHHCAPCGDRALGVLTVVELVSLLYW